jgi:DNA-binding beta-propeller fold protein YncE
LRFSPSSGVTPATVRVSIDPAAFQNLKGTLSAQIVIKSEAAVNIAPAIRVLINNREPDQRGSIVNVAGKLVDIVADPERNRFYILRQDTNEVLVYDGSTYSLQARLRTSNTPTQMAITFDHRYMLVGHDNSQIATMYDLETLEQLAPVRFPGGHYPRSIATTGRSILAATRVAGAIPRDRQSGTL